MGKVSFGDDRVIVGLSFAYAYPTKIGIGLVIFFAHHWDKEEFSQKAHLFNLNISSNFSLKYFFTFIPFYIDIIEMETSFNCYVLSSNVSEFYSVDIYKNENNNKRYIQFDKKNIYLNVFKILHL